MSLSWRHGPIIAGIIAVGLAGAVILAKGNSPRPQTYQAAVDASDDLFGEAPMSLSTNVAPVNAAPTNTAPVNAAPMPTDGAPPVAATDAAALVADLAAKGIQVARNATAERANITKVAGSASEFSLAPSTTVQSAAANFVTYGTSMTTVQLGAGERLAVVRDLFDTLGSTVQADSSKLLLVAEQISNGQKPTVRNLAKERAQVNAMLPAFRKLTGRNAPNFTDPKDDLAWNTMLYRVRFKRDLVKERAGITKFKATFKETPKTPSDWAIVRAWAYALR